MNLRVIKSASQWTLIVGEKNHYEITSAESVDK